MRRREKELEETIYEREGMLHCFDYKDKHSLLANMVETNYWLLYLRQFKILKKSLLWIKTYISYHFKVICG